MFNDQILNDHLQMSADNSARVRRAADKGTVRHARNIEGVSRYYSEAERMNAERIERNKPKDILEILAENPRLNAEDHGRHQRSEYEQNQQRWVAELQAERERLLGTEDK
jgi:hypothetical protein